MKAINLFIFLLIALTTMGQTSKVKNPSINDLEFLVGVWDVKFEWYDTHKPNSKVEFTEKGTMECNYDLDYRGTPKFIICKCDLFTDTGRLQGRKRQTLEAIQWSKFSNSFERTGIYSNWPATGIEKLQFDPKKQLFSLEGELGVQNGMTEKFVETYQFNKDFTSYDRVNIANFSDMPINVYNLTMKSTATKR